MIRILGICGSLRAASVNMSLLRAMRRLAPDDVAFSISPTLGALPLFNPDIEASRPDAVVAFQNDVAAADALVIASPEYAHGVTGAMKNALDWLVGFEPVAYMHCSVVNASPRARHADDSIREILKTMCLTIVEEASVTIPLVGAGLDEDAMVTTPAIADAIRGSLRNLVRAVHKP